MKKSEALHKLLSASVEKFKGDRVDGAFINSLFNWTLDYCVNELGMLPPMQTLDNGRPKENELPFVDYCIRQWESEE
jgi:hypothetical protein